MTPVAPSSRKVMIVDAGHGVGPTLASLLADHGLEVIAWACDGEGAASSDAEPSVRWIGGAGIDTVDAELIASVDAVIFNASALDEAALIADGGLADAIAADGGFFLGALQVVARAMMEAGRGQIWTLSLDDSFAYYMPLPVAPITHHTRIGAVRALAKELSRFGVSANAAVLQPVSETTEPADWQAARAGLASYAQKFKPASLAGIAETLAFWLTRESLPMSGSVIHFGTGAYDGNS